MPLCCRLPTTLAIACLALGSTGTAWATDVAVCTDAGNFTIELFDEQAPLHAANFLEYVDRGFYNGTIFHRVIEGFVVQGGGVTRTFRSKPTLPPVANEADNGLTNDRGTLSAARTSDPDSATSQFYVNLENNANLNRRGGDAGYTVFGRVSDGMPVIDNIAALPTGPADRSRRTSRTRSSQSRRWCAPYRIATRISPAKISSRRSGQTSTTPS